MTKSTEVAFFDADAIQAELDRDPVRGLRMLADALECGALRFRSVSAEGVGGAACDPEMNVLVRLRVSAPARTMRRSEDRGELGDGATRVKGLE